MSVLLERERPLLLENDTLSTQGRELADLFNLTMREKVCETRYK